MTDPLNGRGLSALFPDSAFLNINHLGLSHQSRFAAKQKLVGELAARNCLIGIQELHCSPARAQDAFFSHFPQHMCLYNSNGDAPGQCIMVAHPLLHRLGIAAEVDAIEQHHIVLLANVAHGFWWHHGSKVFLLLNIYLSAQSDAIRQRQLHNITQALRQFKAQHNGYTLVAVTGGDRNFVVKPEQHIRRAVRLGSRVLAS